MQSQSVTEILALTNVRPAGSERTSDTTSDEFLLGAYLTVISTSSIQSQSLASFQLLDSASPKDRVLMSTPEAEAPGHRENQNHSPRKVHTV